MEIITSRAPPPHCRMLLGAYCPMLCPIDVFRSATLFGSTVGLVMTTSRGTRCPVRAAGSCTPRSARAATSTSACTRQHPIRHAHTALATLSGPYFSLAPPLPLSSSLRNPPSLSLTLTRTHTTLTAPLFLPLRYDMLLCVGVIAEHAFRFSRFVNPTTVLLGEVRIDTQMLCWFVRDRSGCPAPVGRRREPEFKVLCCFLGGLKGKRVIFPLGGFFGGMYCYHISHWFIRFIGLLQQD